MLFVLAFVRFLMVLAPLLSVKAQAQKPEPDSGLDPRWLRIYQYQKSAKSYVSDITSRQFYFTEEGPTSPQQEFLAAFHFFSEGVQSSKKFGTLQLPAACAFPARKYVMEQILNHKFPEVPCPDLQDWLGRLQADHVSLVFVGAYTGNAASILGHTFLRFSNRAREATHREGIDLLSHVVGYTAHTSPGDGRISYMIKGLTGAYPGFYDIEPYYMKVGLYNNSESRDLWELSLKMSPKEVELLTQIVWEYSFNVQIGYFFIGRNCSYRLLTLLEAAKPDLDVSADFKGLVLPAETARALITAHLAAPSPRFRASIQRRLEKKVSLLSEPSKQDFTPALRSLEKVKSLQDPNLLDALMDHWLYQNYIVQTQLPADQKNQMEATISRAAELQRTSTLKISNEEIRTDGGLSPPFLGHRPHFVELESGLLKAEHEDNQAPQYFGFHFRWGLHPSWIFDSSYQDISAIEYLGVDLQSDPISNMQWSLLFIRAQTLEDLWSPTATSLTPSWGFHVSLGNDCVVCGGSNELRPERLNLSASFGLAQKWLVGKNHWQMALLPEIYSSVGVDTFVAAPGAALLFKWGHGPWSFYLENKVYFIQASNLNSRSTNEPRANQHLWDARLGRRFSPDFFVFLKSQTDLHGLSGVYFF